MAPTVFDVLRHARTEWNDDHRIQGQTDIPLSLEGREQTKRWIKHLSLFTYHRVISSNLTRAKETADILNRSIIAPQEIDERFREQNWGEWEGVRVKDLDRRFPEALQEQIARGWEFRPPGGESRNQVLARALSALSDTARKYPGERILVVSHGGVIKSLLYHAHGRKYLPWEEEIIKPYHLHRFSHDGSTLTLVQANAVNLETAP